MREMCVILGQKFPNNVIDYALSQTSDPNKQLASLSFFSEF